MTALLGTDELRRMARARDQFLSESEVAPGVRPTIAKSWARSARCGVDATLRQLPTAPVNTRRSRLSRAAQPVLDELSAHLADMSTALLLADREGVILGRWVGDKSLLRLMDRTHSAPGSTLSEDAIGTNGLGSVLEERTAYAVIGPEHYADLFQQYACYGAPIVNPRTHRVEGVLTFVCRVRDSSPLMLPFVASTSAQIAEQLPLLGSHGDKRLIEEFRAATRTSRAPTVLVSDSMIIANPRGAHFLATTDPDSVWTTANHAIHGEEGTLWDAAGADARLTVQPVEEDGGVVGALIRISPQGAGAITKDGSPTDALTLLRSRMCAFDPVWDASLSVAIASQRNRVAVLLYGESGVGKTEFARAVHEVVTPDTPMTVLHAGLADVEGTKAWITRVKDALDGPGTLVIQRVNALDAHDAQLLATVIEASESRAPHQLISTVVGDVEEESLHPDLRAILGIQALRVPGLRERPGDIHELIRRFAASIDVPPPQLTVGAMDAIRAYDWPGNLKQLKRVVQALAMKAHGSPIGIEHLPPDIRDGRVRVHGEIERLERRAIEVTLARLGNNKSRAAEELGVSRATLYRKIRAYRL
ncbi:MAG: helix-turn-helix domain-containing protein [Actinomycetota bacterium]|nr:helix-turn-helix domain-containing protein [Actinomycetota bacterium]